MTEMQAMERSRAARRERVRSRRNQLLLSLAVCAGVFAVLAVAFVASRLYADASPKPKRKSQPALTAEVETAAVVSSSHPATQTPVEVPNVTGRTLPEAQLVLGAAGFVVASKGETVTADGRPAKVIAQSPAPGTKLAQGQQVTITLASADSAPVRQLLVVLDPGHQGAPDLSPEPIGPGSTETKEKATAGACGVATKRQESQIALEVALHMKRRLEAAGVQVLMTRTTNAVNLSNVQRADMANKSGADLFVRIHADAGTNPGVRGVCVLYPPSGTWTARIAAPSKRAAEAVDAAMVRATGAVDGGVLPRSDFAGFNWSKVPVILVETGYLSNADDDKLLANPGYQDKLAAGAVNGILTYFGR